MQGQSTGQSVPEQIYLLTNTRPLLVAGGVLGFGMGGFFDGIVLHQLLQWHHLVSAQVSDSTVEGLQLNTLWDGIFHGAMYVIVVIGLLMLWRAIHLKGMPFAPRIVVGGVMVGWGLFHTFDSIVNHWILQIHHIRMVEDAFVYDLAFFVIGLILLGVGAVVARTDVN